MKSNFNRVVVAGGAILFVGIALLLLLQSWALPIAFVLVLTFLVLTVRKPKIAILLILITKPIIDATWEFRIPAIGLNFLQVIGVLFPVIVFLIIYSNRITFKNYAAIHLFGLFVLINCIAYFLSTVGKGNTPMEGMFFFVKYSGILFQFLNSFAAYVIIPYLFKSEEDRRQLFWALILAGVFPAVTGLLQIGGYISGRTLRTTGELIRLSGLYHDSVNMRIYSFQTILAIYIYLSSYIDPKDKYFTFKRLTGYALIPISLLIIYKGYSKAAMAIFVGWILIYFLFQRKVFTGTAFLVLLGVAYAGNETVQNETEKLFYKEIMYTEGTMPTELEYTLLGGRFTYWGKALDDFERQDLASQMIGYNYIAGGGLHNDFIRILISNGVVGLTVYAILILYFAIALLNAFIIHKDALSLGAIMVFASFIIDSIGLVPLLYPGYCWITFGIISLSLNRDVFKLQQNKTYKNVNAWHPRTYIT